MFEELLAYPKGHKQVWFRRTTADGATSVKGSSYFKVPAAVKPLLNDNMLPLSLLANYPKVDSHKLVLPIVNCFANYVDSDMRSMDALKELLPEYVIKGPIAKPRIWPVRKGRPT